MNPADEMAGKTEPTERQSAGAAAGSDGRLEEQLRDTLKELQRPSPQSMPVEDLHGSDDKLNEQLLIPAEDMHELISVISYRVEHESSERKAIYDRLVVIENQTKRRGSRGFVRYLLAICIGVAATLAWESYGEATKQIIATRAPKLGWSTESKQMIASWIQQLGWTKPPAAPENPAVRLYVPESPQATPVGQTAPDNVTPKAPAAPSFDPEQVHQMARDLAALRQTVEQLAAGKEGRDLAALRQTVEQLAAGKEGRDLAALRQTVEQLAAGQDQMAREIGKLEAADVEILAKIPPRPQPLAAPARKPMPAPPTSRAPTPPH